MDFIQGRAPTTAVLQAHREGTLKEEREEPTFNQAIFDAEFPSYESESEEEVVGPIAKLRYFYHF